MKKFVAVTVPGAEYVYRANTAHFVSKENAGRILEALNRSGHMLRPGEKWHLYTAESPNTVPYRYYIRSNRLYEQEILRASW